ncbi:protein RALF-like 34 [Sesamum indicum]|uniref:Protein RALF-like 34 n=1 Tax=Sesamum indicum TaxID=4182 RepID=A0A6I9SUR8_SESIN|nr:protein RALF-like 34 [Sesamum indicum]
MAAKLPIILIFSLLIVFASGNPTANPEIDSHSGLQPMNETVEWDFPTPFHLESELVQEQEEEEGLPRRSLYWKSPARKYYISYGALSANRVPCPPRSGRSYYTHNCFRARGPVHPYTRGCSAITRCRR